MLLREERLLGAQFANLFYSATNLNKKTWRQVVCET